MNIRSLLILLCAGLFAVLLGDQFGAANSIQEKTRRANKGSPSEFALETSWAVTGPVFQTFHEVPGTGASQFGVSPSMVSGYTGRHSELDFWFGVEGDAVRVTIALSYTDSGVRFETSDAERNLRQLLQTNAAPHVSYLLQPDQKIEVNEFFQYGVKPFEIKIVKVKHVDPPLPSFSSCTDAIQLVSVQRLEGEFPSYRFTVRNVGSRRINWLEGETDTRHGMATNPDRPLAEAGQQFTIEMTAGSKGRLTGDEYSPDTFASFKVTGVVFDDGDFTGDRINTLMTRNRGICTRLTMERVVGLLNERIESAATDLGELRSRVLSVCQDVGVDEMRNPAAKFPESANNSKSISCAECSDSMAKGLLARIDAFERDHSQSATKEQASDFLKSLREAYLEYLSRWKPRSSG